MSRMKRIPLTILAAACALGFPACEKTANPPEPTVPESAPEATEVPGVISERSPRADIMATPLLDSVPTATPGAMQDGPGAGGGEGDQ